MIIARKIAILHILHHIIFPPSIDNEKEKVYLFLTREISLPCTSFKQLADQFNNCLYEIDCGGNEKDICEVFLITVFLFLLLSHRFFSFLFLLFPWNNYIINQL